MLVLWGTVWVLGIFFDLLGWISSFLLYFEVYLLGWRRSRFRPLWYFSSVEWFNDWNHACSWKECNFSANCFWFHRIIIIRNNNKKRNGFLVRQFWEKVSHASFLIHSPESNSAVTVFPNPGLHLKIKLLTDSLQDKVYC